MKKLIICFLLFVSFSFSSALRSEELKTVYCELSVYETTSTGDIYVKVDYGQYRKNHTERYRCIMEAIKI